MYIIYVIHQRKNGQCYKRNKLSTFALLRQNLRVKVGVYILPKLVFLSRKMSAFFIQGVLTRPEHLTGLSET